MQFINLSLGKKIYILQLINRLMIEEKEVPHAIEVLKSACEALKANDSLRLKELSNQTVHSEASFQDSGSITSAVLIYTLSKIIERRHYLDIKRWDKFMKKIISSFQLAESALKERNFDIYEKYMEQARKSVTLISVNLKPYIEEVFRKASINKASKIYEHGVSMGKTAKLLGVTEWELSEYTGQTRIPDMPQNITIDIKERARMALEFFS